MTKEFIHTYWQIFLSTLPADSTYHTKTCSKGGYGDSPELTHEWEAEGKPLPRAGDLWVEVDGRRAPACITETTQVSIRNYNEVDADFAPAEGDLSREHWREAHRIISRTSWPGSERNFRRTCRWCASSLE